jgi:geranylgeranyl pyrophosphate synthase
MLFIFWNNTFLIYLYCRIDDIQDNSILRRGIPVAHSIYGIATTINAANYVLFIALERVISLNHAEVCYHLLQIIFCILLTKIINLL